ncbi:hypothetical protein LAG90_18280 [Marinilongibacter aquaticus]|uniref:hypothetical protein n=1 Tax=Marinilongibacter aquaticus TaxID=2975157 RepID=UPI0021BD5B78|nr:hypothetical protein [Marinilongibacter aquaticus]UBM58751.1 hypothetical protein LAG90_18280 [Marinilongibacter aquaticus]
MKNKIPFTARDSREFFMCTVVHPRSGTRDKVQDIFRDGIWTCGKFFTYGEALLELEFANGQPFGKAG